MTGTTALIVFAKAPIPETVKTRLCPPLTAEEAASLHGSLVLDAIERAKALTDLTLYVAGSPNVTHPFFKVLEGRYAVRLFEQRGADLGSRMREAMHDAFVAGHTKALLTGTDLPNLPRSYLTRAIDLLNTHELVLGPTLDGGYYLVGLRRPVPELFEGIAWSSPAVLRETKKKAEEAGISVGLLPECRDLDDLEDLKAFIQMLGQDRNISKRTEGALRLIANRLERRLT